MVIKDKALIQCMKDAYKGGGYNIVKRPYGRTVIYTPFWMVQIDDANVPREALSLLALHMGFLPEENEAYKIFKGEKDPVVQKQIFEKAMLTVQKMEACLPASDGPGYQAKKTVLTFDGWNVWQKTAGLEVILIDPVYERLFRKREKAVVAGNALYMQGTISRAWVMRRTDGPEHQMEHLAQMQWVDIT